MAPVTKATIFLVSAAITKIASAGTVLAFPDAGCDTAGYYDSISATNDECTVAYLTDSDYTPTKSNTGLYEAYFSLQTQEADGCATVISRNGSDSAAPPCGECVLLIHTANECIGGVLPSTYYAWECCGSECNTQCGGIPGKRSIGRDSKPARTTANIANLKNRSPVSSAPKAKRSDCSFSSSKDLYTQAGYPVSVSDTYQACTSDNGCSESYSGTVESSFSQTFGVSESTEAGLFDIVSESVSFSYDATWESSTSVSVMGSYTFDEGQSGYITFAPLSQCATGTFSGADCDAMSIPTGSDAQTACIPERLQGGSVKGDVNVVTTA